MNKVVIGVGSNIHPARNISEARRILSQKYYIIRESHFVTTKPIGNETQPDFVNGAILIETACDRETLAKELKDIERALGRPADHKKSAPRSIDLDIVVYNGEVVDQDFYRRDFLKHAVLELLPALKY